jgi:hypothetical protein
VGKGMRGNGSQGPREGIEKKQIKNNIKGQQRESK